MIGCIQVSRCQKQGERVLCYETIYDVWDQQEMGKLYEYLKYSKLRAHMRSFSDIAEKLIMRMQNKREMSSSLLA